MAMFCCSFSSRRSLKHGSMRRKNISLTVLSVLSGSSHIRSVLNGVEYRNWHRILDVYLLFVIWMGQIQLKVKTDLHVCNLWTGQFVSYKSVI